MRLSAIAALFAILLAGCGQGPEHYVGVLDELSVPADWQLVYLVVDAPGAPDVSGDPGVPRKLEDCALISCPWVARYYLIDGQPIDIYPTATALLTDAGFKVTSELTAGCDRPETGLGCGVKGALDGDEVWVSIFHPGEDPAGLGIADRDKSMVRVLAQKE